MQNQRESSFFLTRTTGLPRGIKQSDLSFLCEFLHFLRYVLLFIQQLLVLAKLHWGCSLYVNVVTHSVGEVTLLSRFTRSLGTTWYSVIMLHQVASCILSAWANGGSWSLVRVPRRTLPLMFLWSAHDGTWLSLTNMVPSFLLPTWITTAVPSSLHGWEILDN